jgi:FAD/FMN-containing dehydrogenase
VARPAAGGVIVNDVHSQLNPTAVARIESASSVTRVQEIVADAARERRALCIAGGRHAMGGQQFATDGVLIDTRPLDRVIAFHAEQGIVEVEAGIQWPALIGQLLALQAGERREWGIAQKQTGADRLSIGGAVSANAHGRGLVMRPLIDDVEALTLIDADARLVRCSRTEQAELFRLVCGGYGMFGVVVSIALRLTPRTKLRREVEIGEVESLIQAFDARIADGHQYGDFQFAIDPASDDFLRRGVFSTYLPVAPSTPIPEKQHELSEAQWQELLHLAHHHKSEAFARYAEHYLSTSGQIYWSDTHQLSTYLDDYHRVLDARYASETRATEMISELYVPRERLADFMAEVADDFRRDEVDVIYGTVRLIEQDDESVLAWARESWACVIFNLHTEHTPEGIGHSAGAFRRLIDMARARGGTYFLTYHKWATREQVLACHPRLPEFLEKKRKYDPELRFQSDWWRHHVRLMDGERTARGSGA